MINIIFLRTEALVLCPKVIILLEGTLELSFDQVEVTLVILHDRLEVILCRFFVFFAESNGLQVAFQRRGRPLLGHTGWVTRRFTFWTRN